MNLHLQQSEQPHLPKPLKMNTRKQYLKDKFFHPRVYSTCNRQWLRNATSVLKSSSQELSRKAKPLSKSIRSLPHRERNRRSLRLPRNRTLKSSTSTTLKSRERSREGEWDSERGRPLIRPDRHVTLPVPLPDQNPEVHPSTQNQRSGKRKRSMSPTYPGLSGINCSESNCALSYAQRSNCFEPGQLTPNKLNQASLIHHDAPHSPIQSGLTSFKGRPLTSTMSSPASTPLPPIIVAPNRSGKLSSNSE